MTIEVNLDIRCGDGNGRKEAKAESLFVVDTTKGWIVCIFRGRVTWSDGVEDNVFAQLILSRRGNDLGSLIKVSCSVIEQQRQDEKGLSVHTCSVPKFSH